MRDKPLSELIWLGTRMFDGSEQTKEARAEIDRRFPVGKIKMRLMSESESEALVDDIESATAPMLIKQLETRIKMITDQRDDLLEDICPECGSTRWMAFAKASKRKCACGAVRAAPVR